MKRRTNPVHSQFQRGSGVYRCEGCGLRTRGTHRGEAAFRLCLLCFYKKNALHILHNAGHSEYTLDTFDDAASPHDVSTILNEILRGDC